MKVPAQLRKRKANHALCFLLLLFALYIGYSIGLLYGQEVSMENVLEKLEEAMLHPFPVLVTPYTGKATAVCLTAWLIGYLYYVTSVRNYMPGMEYGTARLASPEEINKELKERDPCDNKIISEHIRIGLDDRRTHLNSNMLVSGGAGSGKSRGIVKPNAYNCEGSYVFLDPKGELLRDTGNYFRMRGCRIRVLDLIHLFLSHHYNPFRYIRCEKDIIKLVTNLMANTTPKQSAPTDPFWENAEKMFLQAIMLYVWYEFPKQGKTPNFRGVLELLNKAKLPENAKEQSELEQMTYALPENHPARIAFEKVYSGAADTIRSIIISVHARLAYLQNEEILRILDDDDMDFAALGEGVYGNPDRKTALFCIIPDNDKSYNCIVGMLYTQMFQELYYAADTRCSGRLPVHVGVWMDEFANVALPEDFLNIIATCRSRNISCNIFIQNLAQLKTLFKDAWETVTGNCDTFVYLGGNEQSTHEYVSKLLGKQTIDKRTTGESRGRGGSSSRNYDVFGRELLTPEEVRMMDNRMCLVFVRGYAPVYDEKYRTWEKREYKQAMALGPYDAHEEERLEDEGRESYYIDVTGEDAAAKSVRYQVEAYGGVFEESAAYEYISDCGKSGHKRFPDSFGGYLYDDTEIYPVFSAERENVKTPGGMMHKHAVIGYQADGEFIRAGTDDTAVMFRPENRIIPLDYA